MLKAITATVTRDVEAEDALPLTLQDGDRVNIGQAHPTQADYVWADDGGLCAGWVPRSVLHISGQSGVATAEYCSAQLSVKSGETVRIMWKGQGFSACWCESRGGERGWVADEALSIAPGQGEEA